MNLLCSPMCQYWAGAWGTKINTPYGVHPQGFTTQQGSSGDTDQDCYNTVGDKKRLRYIRGASASAQLLSRVRLFATPWTVAHQAPLSMGFSRQEYWGGLPLPPPGDLPDPGIESTPLASPALAERFFTH